MTLHFRASGDDSLRLSEWLEEEWRLLREVVRQMPGGLAVVEATSRKLMLANDRLVEMVGPIPAQDAVLRLDGSPYPVAEDPMERVIEHGEVIEGERLQYVRADGARLVLEVSVAPLRDASGRITAGVGTVQDVTARNQSEQALRDSEATQRRLADESARTAEFQDLLLGVVGHDLRNPISAVLFAAAQLARSNLDEAQRKMVARVSASAERTLRILESLLDVTEARLGGGIRLSLEEVGLDGLCRELVDEFESRARGRTLRYESLGDARGRFDRSRLSQLLSNLLGNARQYSTPGSEVLVRCSGLEGSVEISVSNRGPAIAPGALADLFEPFKRAAAVRDGGRNLGLGLYIVRQIARAHGGDVEAVSTEAEGTTFTVRLPRSR